MHDDDTVARILAAGLPTPEEQVEALRAIDRENDDSRADRYPYYVDRDGCLWKGVLRKNYVLRAHSTAAAGDTELDGSLVNSLYGLTRVDA